MRLRTAAFVAAGMGSLFVFGSGGPAGANAITTGDCHGSGHWEKSGQDEDSASHNPSDVISIPRADTVDWQGALDNHQLGDTVARRDISGKVELELPKPLGWVSIDSWGGSSVRAANAGKHSYNLPSVLTGVKLKVHGVHRDAGVVTCEGSVFVKVAGSATSNPLLFAGIGGMVLFGGLLLFAGRPVFTKVAPAFEDVNPG